MTAPETPVGVRGRAPILILVVIALVAGITAGSAEITRESRPASSVDAAQRSHPGALTTSWYCPGMPPSFRTQDQSFTLSNLGSEASDAIVTVQPDGGGQRIIRTVSVPGNSVRTFSRSSLRDISNGASGSGAAGGAAAKPGARLVLPRGTIVVEPFSPDVVVSEGVDTDETLDWMPCATTANDRWFFAAGETVRGVKQWLVLANPFSADARVDLSLRTDIGLKLLPNLQGVDVPGRSRVVIPIHENAVRQARVAVEVHAVVGEVVASQTLVYGAASGTTGVASTLGALSVSNGWWFTDGRTLSGASQWVALTTLSELDAHVVVQAFVGLKEIVRPVTTTVASGEVVWVRIGDCARDATGCLQVPDNTPYQLKVQADGDVPIVAQTIGRFDDSDTALGATTSVGSTEPARNWVIARTRVEDERSTSISVMNPNVRYPAHLSVEIVHDGAVDRPKELQHFAVAPNTHLKLPADIAGPSRQHDAAVVITSDLRIFADATVYGPNDATQAPIVPTR